LTAAGGEPSAPTEARPGLAALARHRDVRQFVKFCIVGASSTAISVAIFTLLYYGLDAAAVLLRTGRLPDPAWLPTWLHQALALYPNWQHFAERYHIAVPLAETAAFALAVTNGFYWNRRWTFAHARRSSARRQYAQFVLVNVVGLTLDLIIISVTTRLLHPVAGNLAPLLAKGVAISTVVFWNFLANKYWTFRD
jgi:putative flippase GtrA